jgi:hypothetical protein
LPEKVPSAKTYRVVSQYTFLVIAAVGVSYNICFGNSIADWDTQLPTHRIAAEVTGVVAIEPSPRIAIKRDMTTNV